jgi:multiple sugar transport system permease protein
MMSQQMLERAAVMPDVPGEQPPSSKRQVRGHRFKVGNSVRIVLILIVLGVVVFPLYWMFVTSLTSNDELFGATPRWLPDFTHFDVYVKTFASGKILLWLLNSLIIAVGTTIVSIGLGIPLGYALSRFRFRGKALVGVTLLLTQMLPEALLVVPLFALFKSLNLLNSQAGLILVDSAFVLPIVALILKGAIDGVPRELEEAARVDGCSRWGILTRINLPLIAPTVAAAGVIAFFHGWNEYVFAVTFTYDQVKQPASVGLAGFIGELSTPLDTVMAVGLMYTLPAVVFYLFAQKYVVSGMTAGGVKG